MSVQERSTSPVELPGLDCGSCGYRTCSDLAEQLAAAPDLLKRCIHPEGDVARSSVASTCSVCSNSDRLFQHGTAAYRDSLDREFDFYLEHFPEDPGPREIILPHNPIITRELEIQRGDVLIGRPLGMSCGCPITHCGIVREVDHRTGVLTWCVTGPLQPRQSGYKDLGYYIAEGYEGLIKDTRSEIKIGARYFFQPRLCMLQWRHSGLVNYINRTAVGMLVRLVGLWFG
jgi:uncharacterized Fe-S cluster-containing protein